MSSFLSCVPSLIDAFSAVRTFLTGALSASDEAVKTTITRSGNTIYDWRALDCGTPPQGRDIPQVAETTATDVLGVYTYDPKAASQGGSHQPPSEPDERYTDDPTPEPAPVNIQNLYILRQKVDGSRDEADHISNIVPVDLMKGFCGGMAVLDLPPETVSTPVPGSTAFPYPSNFDRIVRLTNGRGYCEDFYSRYDTVLQSFVGGDAELVLLYTPDGARAVPARDPGLRRSTMTAGNLLEWSQDDTVGKGTSQKITLALNIPRQHPLPWVAECESVTPEQQVRGMVQRSFTHRWTEPEIEQMMARQNVVYVPQEETIQDSATQTGGESAPLAVEDPDVGSAEGFITTSHLQHALSMREEMKAYLQKGEQRTGWFS
ncbi:uncharacterized protein MKK02DRAFT_29420 [Dioszegia hungarica]|uniref:Uncharacterized protein n=1 Tax=Dioszegia hungarica TaxID=4972 RepID=A0AA38HF79_9TREE|nr:uncharacterized protein MKK02DRAFT_29420 [Dioszegia hungarica]KAI9639335.1 hypothetical protein MKK02DRAFT_29420 [Dioszegia hungarica]